MPGLPASRRTAAERFAAEARAVGAYRWAGVYDVTPSEVIRVASSGDGPSASARFSARDGLAAGAIASGGPVLADAATGSALIVPVLDGRGRVVGTLHVAAERPGAFGADGVARLRALAQRLGPLFTGLSVRVATAGDAAACAAIYAPYVERTVISFEERAPDADDVRARITATLEHTPWLVADLAGEVVAYAYASRHRERAAYRWAIDTSVYVADHVHGRGAGRRLYDALFPILVRQGFRRACAGITLPNDASVGIHRAFGFEPVGTYRRIAWKHGAWHDVLWLERPLGDAGAPPSEPIPFPALG